MGKIIVSRKLAEAIDDVRGAYDDERLLTLHVQTKIETGKSWESEWKPLNDLAILEMSKVIIFGYEVEPTPEEKLLELYKQQVSWSDTNDLDDKRAHTTYSNAIRKTLDVLGIVVKGINDYDN